MDKDQIASGNGGDAAACGPSPGPGCSAVSVTVSDHPRGCLVCIDHDGQCLYLTAQEAQDLFDQLDDKLGQIPIGPIPSPHRYTAINHQQNPGHPDGAAPAPSVDGVVGTEIQGGRK